jgi:hypothetical protein
LKRISSFEKFTHLGDIGKMSIAIIVLAILSSILTIGATAAIGDIYATDAAGRGMTEVFAMGLAIVLWIFLGAFVAVAKAKGAFSLVPGWLLSLITIALACSCFTAMVLITKVGEHSPFRSSLMLLVPAGSVLVLVYGLLESFGAFPHQHAANITLIGGIVAAMLAVAPWIVAVPAMSEKRVRDEEVYAAWQKREAAEEQRKNELEAIPEPGTMEQFLEFVEVPPDWSGAIPSAATQRIRALPNRQEEAERLLKQLDLRVLLVESDIDLKVTPALIEGTKSCFRKLAEHYRPDGPTASFDSVSDALNPYYSTLRWLNENGHTPKEEVDMLATMAQQYPESGSRLLFVAGLEYYRNPPNP